MKGDYNSDMEKYLTKRHIDSSKNIVFVLMEALDQIYLNHINFIVEAGLNKNFQDVNNYFKQLQNSESTQGLSAFPQIQMQ